MLTTTCASVCTFSGSVLVGSSWPLTVGLASVSNTSGLVVSGAVFGFLEGDDELVCTTARLLERVFIVFSSKFVNGMSLSHTTSRQVNHFVNKTENPNKPNKPKRPLVRLSRSYFLLSCRTLLYYRPTANETETDECFHTSLLQRKMSTLSPVLERLPTERNHLVPQSVHRQHAS